MNLTLFVLACGICLLAQDNSGPTAGVITRFPVSAIARGQSRGREIKGTKIPLAGGNTYGKLPLIFETNQGQTDARVKFLARAPGYTLFVTADEAVFAGRDGSVERMKLIGANRKAHVELLDKQPGISNYFIGNDPSKWRTNIPNHGRVALRGVYPGIDLVFYGNERQLEYDWVVAPGADPKPIRVMWEGTSQVTKNASGDLVLSASLVQQKPVILQEGKRIEGGYVVRGREVAFELAQYDAAKPLVIDPVLVYSTYLGGSQDDYGEGIAVDGSGNTYLTGFTQSTNFPVTSSLQASKGGSGFTIDAFVTKINAAGSALVYSTYLGGSGYDIGTSIAVDGSGNAYLTGGTASTNFPTANPLQASNVGGESDAFVTKINAGGSGLVYSTYLGGNQYDYGYGVAVDGSGNAYVTGLTVSTDFPTANPLQASHGGSGFQPTQGDAFVTKINAAGSALVYSTYLGGRWSDHGSGIAVDGSGNAYVTGATGSDQNFPTAKPIQASYGGGGEYTGDAFVTKINVAGSALVYSTYLGGSGSDYGYGIAVDGLNNAYVTGFTQSTNFPTANPLQASYGGGDFIGDVFVAGINALGSALVYSTYLGGRGNDVGTSIAVDGLGKAYVTGHTDSTNFPTANPIQAGNVGGESDAFVLSISPLPEAPWQEAITAMKTAAGIDSLNFWQWSWYWQRSPAFPGAPLGFGVLGSIDNTPGMIDKIVAKGGANGFEVVSAEQWVLYYRQAAQPPDPWQQTVTTMKASGGAAPLNFWLWAWYWQRSPAFPGAPLGFGVLGSIDDTPGMIDKIVARGGGNGFEVVSAEQWVLHYRQATSQ